MEMLLHTKQFFLIGLLLLFVCSCTTEQIIESDSESEFFIKAYNNPDAFHGEILIDDEGSANIIGIDDYRNLQIITIDREGTQTRLSANQFDKTGHPSGSQLIGEKYQDKWLVVDRFAPQFMILNKTGEIQKHETFNWFVFPGSWITGNPFIGEDDVLSIANSYNGWHSALSSYAVYDFDLNTNTRDSFFIPINQFDGFVKSLNVFYRTESEHYLIGHIQPNGLSRNERLFVTKWSNKERKLVDFKVLDLHEKAINNRLTDFVTDGVGNAVVLSSSQFFYSVSSTNVSREFFVTKINVNLNKEWFTPIKIEGAYAFAPLHLSKINNGYLVVGWCWPNADVDYFPFMCTLNENGKLESQKIFDLRNSRLVTANETDDGKLLLFGESEQFGKNLDNGNQFLIKCDREGNFN
jgi:hypothetical protein